VFRPLSKSSLRSGASVASAVLAFVASYPSGGDAAPLGARPFAQGAKIQHVVIIMQENRSFDNLFQGFPGADTVPSGKNSSGQTIALTPISMTVPYDIDHQDFNFHQAYDNGKMDGFNIEDYWGNISGYPNPEYGYVPLSESQPYFNIASQYVLADRMFTSHIDASFVSHQYIIAGQAARAVNNPTSTWGCDGGPSDMEETLTANRTYGPWVQACFDYTTIGDELDAKGLQWRFYAPALSDGSSIWSPYQAVRHIRYGADWSKVVSPPSQVLTDVANGSLGAVTWITPEDVNSDHSGSGSATGPQWVTSIVNAVGQSQFWNSTAIFLFWDEWGGWYDHVAPKLINFDGHGFRVPLVVVSPYAKRGYVSHVTYDHGSILRFVENTFKLAPLAFADRRATSPAADCFDFSAQPRPFTPFAAKLPPSYFIHQRPTGRAPDAL
jgi:phospholipase C